MGCQTDNLYLCLSFPGKAPLHAVRHSQYQRQRSKARQSEREKEAQELIGEVEARVFKRSIPASAVKVVRR